MISFSIADDDPGLSDDVTSLGRPFVSVTPELLDKWDSFTQGGK